MVVLWIIAALIFCILIAMEIDNASCSAFDKKIERIEEDLKRFSKVADKYNEMIFLMEMDPYFFYDDKVALEYHSIDLCVDLDYVKNQKERKKMLEATMDWERKNRDVCVMRKFLSDIAKNIIINDYQFYTDEIQEIYNCALNDIRRTEEYYNGEIKEIRYEQGATYVERK